MMSKALSGTLAFTSVTGQPDGWLRRKRCGQAIKLQGRLLLIITTAASKTHRPVGPLSEWPITSVVELQDLKQALINSRFDRNVLSRLFSRYSPLSSSLHEARDHYDRRHAGCWCTCKQRRRPFSRPAECEVCEIYLPHLSLQQQHRLLKLHCPARRR
jgi:hypothetical protein